MPRPVSPISSPPRSQLVGATLAGVSQLPGPSHIAIGHFPSPSPDGLGQLHSPSLSGVGVGAGQLPSPSFSGVGQLPSPNLFQQPPPTQQVVIPGFSVSGVPQPPLNSMPILFGSTAGDNADLLRCPTQPIVHTTDAPPPMFQVSSSAGINGGNSVSPSFEVVQQGSAHVSSGQIQHQSFSPQVPSNNGQFANVFNFPTPPLQPSSRNAELKNLRMVPYVTPQLLVKALGLDEEKK